jgi:transcriptional regulator GlxA family with amidase domain
MRIAIAVFEGVEELDFAGPYEVLARWGEDFPDDDVQVFTVAESLEPVQCANGLKVLPHLAWPQVGPVDVLVYPGGRGTRRNLEAGDPVHDRLRALAASGCLMTSVCTGSLVFAATGLLHERPAATHWTQFELLTKLDPSIEPRPDDRFVDEGDIVTSAGVSAGIDMALHLIARLHSPERARQVKKAIQYDPQPPV